LGEIIDRLEFYLELDYVAPDMEFRSLLLEELKRTG
jgi:hypothetical protein